MELDFEIREKMQALIILQKKDVEINKKKDELNELKQ
jgi:hypothetical protein